MKIGVISDIHSNYPAFRACAEYMEKEGCEEYLFLGDYISDTPYTRETMDYLYAFTRKHPCRLLRGNREDYMIAQRRAIEDQDTDRMWVFNSASGNLLFTYRRLTGQDLDYFESLPISFVYEKQGYPAITCCHGSPGNTRELLQLDGAAVRHCLGAIGTDYLLCAHTHKPGSLEYGGRHYFNSGCVGIAIGDAGYAQCMILHGVQKDGRAGWEPEFLKIPYDRDRVVADIVSSGLLQSAPWFINSNILTLLTGRDVSSEMVSMAIELAAADGAESRWPLLEEQYFAEAARRLEIPDYRETGLSG